MTEPLTPGQQVTQLWPDDPEYDQLLCPGHGVRFGCGEFCLACIASGVWPMPMPLQASPRLRRFQARRHRQGRCDPTSCPHCPAYDAGGQVVYPGAPA